MVEKRVFQEASSRCSFCSEAEVSSLEIHHIDGNPSNNAIENLLLVCASCHSKITARVIAEKEIRRIKGFLGSQAKPNTLRPDTTVSVSILHSRFRGDIAHTINKFVSPNAPRPQYPQGSLGADLIEKGYVDYLIAQYYKCRKADASYGQERPFSHAEIHTTIQRRFGFRTFFMPVERFSDLVQFLQSRIDGTILGKNNGSRDVRNYHSFDEHVKQK